MRKDEINSSEKDERFETVSIELDVDEAQCIEEYIKIHPELGHTTVEQHLESLFQINVGEILGEINYEKSKEVKPVEK